MKNWTKQIKDILSRCVQAVLGVMVAYDMPRQVNQNAINQWITWLNNNSPANQRQWFAIDGFVATVNAVPLVNGQVQFNPTYGIYLKAFYNHATAEMRFFDARRFIV